MMITLAGRGLCSLPPILAKGQAGRQKESVPLLLRRAVRLILHLHLLLPSSPSQREEKF